MAKKEYNNNILLSFVEEAEAKEAIKSLPLEELGLVSKIINGLTSDAINYLRKNESPAILLIDISKSELPLTDLKNIIDSGDPSVEIIVIGDKNDVGLFRSILAMGAVDYIVKPLRAEIIMRKLRELVLGEDQKSSGNNFIHKGQLITFIGAHGGVGTSTIAANCSWIMSHVYDKFTGLIDLDFKGGSLAYFFNLPQTEDFARTLLDFKSLDVNIIESLLVKYDARLGILSSTARNANLSNLSHESIEQIINIFESRYNYTIIDLPSKPDGALFQAIATLSNVVVIVADLTLFSVAEVLWILEILKNTTNFSKRVIILINKYKEYKEGYLTTEQFEATVGHKIDFIINFDSKTPLVALNEGIPLAKHPGNLSKSMHNFMDFLLNKPSDNKSGITSFLQKLGLFKSKSKNQE